MCKRFIFTKIDSCFVGRFLLAINEGNLLGRSWNEVPYLAVRWLRLGEGHV